MGYKGTHIELKFDFKLQRYTIGYNIGERLERQGGILSSGRMETGGSRGGRRAGRGTLKEDAAAVGV